MEIDLNRLPRRQGDFEMAPLWLDDNSFSAPAHRAVSQLAAAFPTGHGSTAVGLVFAPSAVFDVETAATGTELTARTPAEISAAS
jgi:hypothetical protein